MDLRTSSKFRQTTTGAQLRRRREQGPRDDGHNIRAFSRQLNHYQTQVRRCRSSEWDRDSLGTGPGADLELPGSFHTGTTSRPAMKTLDKAISMSSDQLDTLTSDRMRSMMQSGGPGVRASYRLPPPGQNNASAAPATGADGNVIFKYKGAEYSKNEYFFGIKSEQSNKKTAYQMFLEDDGPYSRKLFGPIAQKVENGTEKLSFRNFVYKSKRHFTLQNDDDGGCDTKQVVRKGILWHQRDKLFSRWKERFFILTKDYFHCFKKDVSKLSEMGEFLFKVRLTNIEAVSLLDKRGYLTIVISQRSEGRVYLRLQEGIRDWFYHIQSTVYESKKRRKFWVKGPTYPSHTNNRLARLYGSDNNIAEEDIGAADDEEEASDNNNNVPRGINRLSLVSDLLMNEARSEEKLKQKSLTKSEDSGHDSGQSSLNTGCESFSESSG